tara:strand:+ start:328 stop:432 length:105 start_codon:yes stop_codon:yes gene_type:complete
MGFLFMSVLDLKKFIKLIKIMGNFNGGTHGENVE